MLAAIIAQQGRCQRWQVGECWDGPGLEKIYTLKGLSQGSACLKTVDDTLIPHENAHNVTRVPIPDEKLAVVGTRHYKLTIAAKEVGLLDVSGCVACAQEPRRA